MKPVFDWLFFIGMASVLFGFASDLQAQSGWPTTRFKVDFAATRDATSPGQDRAPQIIEPGRKPSLSAPGKDESEQNRNHRIESHAVLALFFEQSLQDAAEALAAAGFEPPSLPLYTDGSGSYYKLNVFDFSKHNRRKPNDPEYHGIYHSGTLCGDTGISTSSWFAVDAADFVPLTPSGEAFLYIVLAHELIHAIAANYPASTDALNGCSANTDDDETVSEGIADALAYKLASRRWPRYYQLFSTDTSHGKNDALTVRRFNAVSGLVDADLLGLRSYQTPFLDKSASTSNDLDHAAYQTSSFWYNVIDRFGMRFIDHLYRQPLRYGDFPSIILWLDDALESYLPGTSGLYIIFPHFVTEFASQVGSRVAEENFGIFGKEVLLDSNQDSEDKLKTYRGPREWWITNILGECERRELNPFGNTEAEIDIELDRLAASCIEISWQGFAENFELDFELESPDLGLLEQLQFGLIYEFTGGNEKYCYDWVHADYSDPLRTCLHEKPFVKNGPQQLSYIKDWAEIGARFTGTGNRIISISNIAEKARKTRPITASDGVKLRVGMVKAQGEDAREYDPPNAGPSGVGSVSAGPETLYGITRNPAPASSRLSFSIPVVGSDLAYGVQWTGEPPPMGYTGPYRGMVSKSSSGKAAIGSVFCSRHAGGVVGQITRLDRNHLQVEIDADLCQATIPPPANGVFPKVDHLKVSLDMPFGWRYSAENAPVDIVTPGMQIFIDRHAKRLPKVLSGEWQNPGTSISNQATSSSSGGKGTATMAGPGASGTPSNVTACNCSCQEYRQMSEAGEAAKREGRDADRNKLAGKMMGCVSQCQSEYLICALDMGEEEKARREKQRTATPEAECDCSCEGFKSLESRMTGLGKRLESGDMAVIQEMEQLGACMSVCVQSFSNCMQGRTTP